MDDPKPNIGSGSAALNALLCVAERLTALQGLKVGLHEHSLEHIILPVWNMVLKKGLLANFHYIFTLLQNLVFH